MALLHRHRGIWNRVVQNDAFERIAIIVPRGALQRAHRIGIARFPTHANPVRAEVDILGVVFMVEPGCEQPHDMHLRPAAVLGQSFDDGVAALTLRYVFHQFRNDVAQLVHLALPRDAYRPPSIGST
jgi:hypothetical protein